MAKKLSTQKLHSLTLDSNFNLLKEYTFEPNFYTNFDYIAKFKYNDNNRVEKIILFDKNDNLISEISKSEIEELNTQTLRQQSPRLLKEKIKDGETSYIKILFLYNCFFN